MPQVLEDYRFGRAPSNATDFTPYLDGKPVKFVRGEDFDVTAAAFAQRARTYAKLKGYGVRCSVPDEGVCVVRFEVPNVVIHEAA